MNSPSSFGGIFELFILYIPDRFTQSQKDINMKKVTVVLDLYVPMDSDSNEANEALCSDLGSFLSDLQMGGGQVGDLPVWRIQVTETLRDHTWFSQSGIEDEELF